MINASKFRVGNYFKWSEFASMGIGIDQITQENHYIHPQLRNNIKIDEDWLIKLGFEYYAPLKHYRIVIDDIWIEVVKRKDSFWFSFTNLKYDETQSMPSKKVEYVHKLQNLFYEVINEELPFGQGLS